MAKELTPEQWKLVNDELDKDTKGYGLPDRIYGSVVFASFNIRKLGSEEKRSDETWAFLGKLCRRFDLLAVQEVMGDLSGLERLQREMGPEYSIIVSDKTGAFPGDLGLEERLAFIYRWSLVRRKHIVSDITYDRSKVIDILEEQAGDFIEALTKYQDERKEFADGDRDKKPDLKLPAFLSFIRQPYATSFEILGHPGTAPYQIMAVNAHLIFGEMRDRKREFNALMEWLVARSLESESDAFPGLVLLGDLNLDFDDPESDIGDITEHLNKLKADDVDEPISAYFPFLEKHPDHDEVFRTNARKKQTYDQIGMMFPSRLVPEQVRAREAGAFERGPDYGVVDFVRLFARALEGKDSLQELDKDERKEFFSLFEHSVSDHMPIWVRVPLPDFPE